ncbi:uncharacterized protein VP01_4827g1 [Puccinia sorghi]|uniref:Uncharacterized protein n=1 Tax=Puccinia sorghi TaxID=27349 RepID=A0A0L6UN85_9BASI|nr:uncharacterized protein VP01_4827g1 [Puccinia sorghi]
MLRGWKEKRSSGMSSRKKKIQQRGDMMKAASKKKYICLVALLRDGIRALSEHLNSKVKPEGRPQLKAEIDDTHEPTQLRKTNNTACYKNPNQAKPN